MPDSRSPSPPPSPGLVLATMGPYNPVKLGIGAQYIRPNTVDFGGLSILTQLSGCYVKKWFSSARRDGGVATKSLFTGQLTTTAFVHADHPSDPVHTGQWSIASIPCVAASWVVYKKDGIGVGFPLDLTLIRFALNRIPLCFHTRALIELS